MDTVHPLSIKLNALMQSNGESLVSIESCTGGAVGAAITSCPGVSSWYLGGWIVYSDFSKNSWLSVPDELIQRYGAISEEVTLAMVEHALNASSAMFAIALTGIAGPDGASQDKPVGTVHLAWQHHHDRSYTSTQHFAGDRSSICQAAVEFALNVVISYYQNR